MSGRALKTKVVLAVMVLSFLFPSIPIAGVPEIDESLVLCLSFNEARGAVVKDHSLNRFHGTVDGAQRRAGKFGRALWFDGNDDFVSVPDSPVLRLLDGCTLMAWINLEGRGSSVWPRIFCKELRTGSDGGFHMPIDWNGGVKMRFVIDGADGYTSPEALDIGKWYHTAVTCDGQKTRIYLNGKMILEVPQENPFPDTNPELQIGNSPAGDRPFHGLIDEARIWSRALSRHEIQRQMNMSVSELVSVEPLSKFAATWGSAKADRR